MLTKEDLERYDRQIMLYGFGEEGQEKLKKARVLIAGIGGLGSPAAIYLAAAGIGNIKIIDHDRVELSNLNRQVLHWNENIGERKIDSAASKLKRFNPDVNIETVADTLSETNITKYVSGCDAIVDAMDNLPTRYLLNKIAIEKGLPFFHGAVYGFEGRAMTVIPGKSACLNCLYHGASMPREKFPVIGVAPAIIGCIQATEVIKYITGLGELLIDRLLIYDGLRMTFSELRVNRESGCEHCGDYQIG
jgi:molybdopterin/thiamine biosynthesis adenylyltransferase